MRETEDRVVNLYSRRERDHMGDWGQTIDWVMIDGGPPVISIRSYDNFDERGRAPTRFESEEMSVEEFLRIHPPNDPAVIAYRRHILSEEPDEAPQPPDADR